MCATGAAVRDLSSDDEEPPQNYKLITRRLPAHLESLLSVHCQAEGEAGNAPALVQDRAREE